MRGKLLMCDHAVVHPDATFSVLRAGFDTTIGVRSPIAFRGTLVVRVECDMGDLGKHPFDLRCMNEDGKVIAPPVAGTLDAPQGGGANNLVLGIDMNFPEPGTYVFILRIDNVEADRWAMRARLHDPGPPPETPHEPDSSNTE